VKVVGARGRCGHVHGTQAQTTARMQGNKTGNFFVGPGSVEVFSSHDTNAMKIPRRQLFHSFLCHFMAQEAISQISVPFQSMRSYFIASCAISWHKKLFHSFLCHFMAQEAIS